MSDAKHMSGDTYIYIYIYTETERERERGRERETFRKIQLLTFPMN